jgi:purine-binding chemotaxis protein CheW
VDILLFDLDGSDYGLPLHAVLEVVRAVAVTPLVGAPAVVDGVIDFRGSVVPVFSLRRRFGLPDQPLSPAERFIVTESRGRTAALRVDDVRWIASIEEGDLRRATDLVLGGAYVVGAVSMDQRLVMLHDLEAFLSAAEEESLNGALTAHSHGSARA